MKKFGMVLKKKFKLLMVAKKLIMGDIWKNRFESNDDLPVNKPIKLRLLTTIIRILFSENGKFYPQSFLDDAPYKL